MNCGTYGAMKFIQVALDKTGLSLRKLANKVGASHQTLSNLRKGSPQLNNFMQVLCRCRKESKLSWSKFGKMLDDEFLD